MELILKKKRYTKRGDNNEMIQKAIEKWNPKSTWHSVW